MRFLTRKNLMRTPLGAERRYRFLTRKKWRDRALPEVATAELVRGPVYPALGIFEVLKLADSGTLARIAAASVHRADTGGKAMPALK